MEKNYKIRKHTAADLVCDSIKEMISSGTWKSNQKLPSESELAETFGVNRLTVRIALQKLNALGILDTRVGDGTYVCHFDLSEHIKDLSEFYVTPKLLEDVSEFRTIFEVECARLAIDKHTAEDLKGLAECCQQFEDASKLYFSLIQTEPADPSSLTEAYDKMNLADLSFHSYICSMTHNDLLIYAFSVAKPAILKYLSAVSESRIASVTSQDWIGGAKGHWDLYHAIENRDYETCKALYLSMVDFHNPTPFLSSKGNA